MKSVNHTSAFDVGVIVPVFRPGPHITNIVKSLRNQTFKNFRVILIDDDHTDEFQNLKNSLLAVQDSDFLDRLVFLSTPCRASGPAVARNVGLENSTEPFISFFDCDDYWYPTFLEEMYRSILSQPADVVVCHSVTNSGERKIRLSLPVNYTRRHLFQTNILSMPCVMVRVDALREKSFPISPVHEDYAFWLVNIHKGVRIKVLQQVLVDITKTENSVSSPRFMSLVWFAKLIFSQRDARWLMPLYLLTYVFNAINKRHGFINRIVVF